MRFISYLRYVRYLGLMSLSVVFILVLAFPALPFLLIAIMRGIPLDPVKQQWDDIKKVAWELAE